eukprot:15042262-Alexandrium_andersonii.AAC.1
MDFMRILRRMDLPFRKMRGFATNVANCQPLGLSQGIFGQPASAEQSFPRFPAGFLRLAWGAAAPPDPELRTRGAPTTRDTPPIGAESYQKNMCVCRVSSLS